MPDNKGLLIVYTGPGKGKTTCALGTAFRAVGQGLRVLMVQFIKGSWHYGELDAAKMLGDDKMEILPMGRGFVKVGGAETDPEDVRLCEEAWSFALARIQSEKYDLVVLDEINYVISYHMLDPEQVVLLALDSRQRKRPGFLAKADVLGIGLRSANFYETSPHREDFHLVVAQHFGGVKLPVMPGSLDELYHEHAQALTHCAKRRAQRAGRLALPRTGINDEQT